MLDVRLLGGLSAAVGGRPVELPADARARELLARLALASAPQRRSVLAGRLRPDVPEETARKTLRSALYELRRSLGDARDAIVVAGEEVALAEDVRVDVREFRRLVAAGALEEAAEAGRGRLLEGMDGDWAAQAREEHAAALAELLGTLAARAEEAGDPAAAVAWARRRLEVDPLSEAAHRDVIRLLALGGDRPAALTHARALGERLRTELGVPPSAATRALVEDVRRGRVARPAGEPAAPPLPAALAAVTEPEGRAAPLARLQEAWALARGGRPAFALITGEPGIGKTTLAGELARRAHAAGAAVLLGRCDEHALVPFLPWIEALERLLDALPAADADHWLTAHGGALARLLPARSAGEDTVAGPRERYLAFELVGELLADVAARLPVLLVLDDVHWADADSLALLRHVARSASHARLLVVLCARPAELGTSATQAIAGLRREESLTHVELDGLDDDSVAALLSRRTGSADREAARRLRARSGGNPLFLDELVREEQEAGAVPEAPPAGVREVIARRLSHLGDATAPVLDAAAVCGVEFDVRTVARVTGRPVEAVLEALDGAVAAALVAETDRHGRYAFTHALVAETIVFALPASARARLHLRIAEELAARHDAGGTGAGEVVRHLRGAGALVDAERLVAWELAAAREATAAFAHAEAAGHLEAALAVGGDAAERGELLLALGDAHDRAGRRAQARAAFARAARLAGETGDQGLLARAALGHGGVAVVITTADPDTVRLLEDALAAVPREAAATSARLLARLAIELYYADPPRARELSALAVERAAGARDPAALAAALNARRVALWSPAHVDERLALAGEMVTAAEAAGDREATLRGRNWRVVDLLELGRLDEAAAEVDAYEALADEVALPHFRWYVPLWRATLAQLAGRWEQAAALSDEASETGGHADDPNTPLFAGIQRAFERYVRRGMSAMDRARLLRGAATSPAPTEWLVYVALLDAETGALDAARRQVAELSAPDRLPAMNANWHGACILAEAAVLVGDRDAGARLYDLLAPHARLFPVVARAVACLGSAEYHLGRLAGLLGRHDEAVARLRVAAERNERAGAHARAALALARLGEAQAAAGDHGAARVTLQEAVARGESLGMPAVAAVVEQLAPNSVR